MPMGCLRIDFSGPGFPRFALSSVRVLSRCALLCIQDGTSGRSRNVQLALLMWALGLRLDQSGSLVSWHVTFQGLVVVTQFV